MSAAPALFAGEGFAAFELSPEDAAEVQRVYEAAPSYFRIALGAEAEADAARKTFELRPPPDMAYSRKRVIGFRAPAGELAAVADVIEDLMAAHVWHVGLFLVPERLHGSGFAQRAYAALEAWMAAGGAQWLRLGVVGGNDRAERFWRSRGYRLVREREGVAMGRKVNRLLVMAKPLAGATLEEYFALVARDRPRGG